MPEPQGSMSGSVQHPHPPSDQSNTRTLPRIEGEGGVGPIVTRRKICTCPAFIHFHFVQFESRSPPLRLGLSPEQPSYPRSNPFIPGGSILTFELRPLLIVPVE